jgi:hypothetical protein
VRDWKGIEKMIAIIKSHIYSRVCFNEKWFLKNNLFWKKKF